MEGNQMKIREALEAALPIMRNCPFTHYNTTEVDAVVSKMEAALAAPPRNCDVGTADEQYARWRRFCDNQKCCNNQCPVYKLADVCESKTRCNLIWAQMPYEQGGAK